MKKPITIISSISILLFLVAIIWLGAGIYIDKKGGNEKADKRYEALLLATKENFSRNSYGSSEFAKGFIRAIGNIDDFSSLKLEINGELVYSYPPETFSLPSPDLVKSYSETVYLGEKSFTLKASLYLMTPGSVYKHSRFAFLLILVGTLIVGVVIVLMNGSEIETNYTFRTRKAKSRDYPAFKEFKKTRETKEESEEQEEDSVEERPTEENLIDENIFEEKPTEEKPTEEEPAITEKKPLFNPEKIQSQQTADAKTEVPAESKSEIESEEITIEFPDERPVFTKEDEEFWNNEEIPSGTEEKNDVENSDEGGLDIIDQLEQQNLELSDEDFFGTNSHEEPKDEPLPNFEENEPSAQAEEPKLEDQISPITNLHLQAALEPKLDEVIQNGYSQATLVLLKINGLDRGNSISQSIVAILKDTNPDAQIFEYKADSYALIAQNSDLQTTVDNFEQIYNKIADYLKNNNATNEVSAGISSVSGRKVKAERVILEAGQALDYASQDPDSPIVAFRVNPEKYKEFAEAQ